MTYFSMRRQLKESSWLSVLSQRESAVKQNTRLKPTQVARHSEQAVRCGAQQMKDTQHCLLQLRITDQGLLSSPHELSNASGHSTHCWAYTHCTTTRTHWLSKQQTHSPSNCRRDSWTFGRAIFSLVEHNVQTGSSRIVMMRFTWEPCLPFSW